MTERRPSRGTSWWPIVAGLGIAALAIAYAMFFASGPPPAASPHVRLQVRAETLDFSTGTLPFALSPDGLVLAYIDYDGPTTRLFLRRMDSFDVQSVSGTEGAGAPFFSPDGEWIGFFAYGQLKKAALAGGRPIDLCSVAHAPGGATWLSDDTIIYSMAFTPTGLYRVSADGGAPEALALPNRDAGEVNYHEPQVLLGERWVVFTASTDDGQNAALLDLESGDVSLVRGVQGRVRYVPSGHLIYGDTESLLAVPFDVVTGKTTGAPVAVLGGLSAFMGGASFAVSPAGTLAYTPAAPIDQVWVDRNGTVTLGVDDTTGSRPILSRDGKRLAVAGGTSLRGEGILIYDLERGGRIRLPGFAHMQWSPDDSEIFTMLRRDGPLNLYRQHSDGAGEPELVFESPNSSISTGISPDGEWLLFYEQHPVTSRDIWALRLDGSGKAHPLVVTPASERSAVFSPDGRWFAYASNASGRDEVYVRRFEAMTDGSAGGGGREYLVSTDGGREPQWSRDGTEMFYRVGRAMMVVPLDLRDGFRAGEPRKLFEGNWGVETGGQNQMYDVTPDGQRFVMVRMAEASNTVHVVLGWLDELERSTSGESP